MVAVNRMTTPANTRMYPFQYSTEPNWPAMMAATTQPLLSWRMHVQKLITTVKQWLAKLRGGKERQR
jgi:hypothetical protein